MRRVLVTVDGKVQGVFFRQSTLNVAKALNITGYVKNLKSGQVEVGAQGGEEDIQKLIEWLKKGPPMARVTNLSVKDLPITSEHSDFKILF